VLPRGSIVGTDEGHFVIDADSSRASFTSKVLELE
jgi:hypothetical protein